MLRSNDQISNRENASNQANDLKNDQFSLPTLTSTRVKMDHFKQFMDPSTIRFCAVFLHYTPKTRLSPKLNLGMGPIFRHSRVTSYNPKFLLEGGGTRRFQVRS